MEASPSASTEDTERHTEACMIHSRCSSYSPGCLCRESPREDTCREADEDAVAVNDALASTFENQENPPFPKRQRRPSVRLEDPGDQHASPARDKRKKKTGKFVATGVCMSNAGGSFDDGGGAQKSFSCCLSGAAETSPAIYKATKLQQILNNTRTKVQDGGKKPGPSAPHVAGEPVKKLRHAGMSIRARCTQKTSCVQDAKDLHFNKENNAYTPTGNEASRYHDAISPIERRDRDDTVLLGAHQGHQSRGFFTARVQGSGERAMQWTQVQASKLTGDADGKCMARANVSLHVPKGKLIVKGIGPIHGAKNKHVQGATGHGNKQEMGKKNAVLRQRAPPLWLGVREWLEELGLGKYVQLFEAHEVEPEILPLLTLNDLREMGVDAVGSRRKMFFAIQHIRKALLAQAEK